MAPQGTDEWYNIEAEEGELESQTQGSSLPLLTSKCV